MYNTDEAYIKSSFKAHFGLEPRPEQLEAIQKVCTSFNNGKNVVLCADTGIGKTLIAAYLALQSEDGYIITNSRSLQDQYKNDPAFETVDLKSLKGAGNYGCRRWYEEGGSETYPAYKYQGIGLSDYVSTVEELCYENKIPLNDEIDYCDCPPAQRSGKKKRCEDCYYVGERNKAADAKIAVLNPAMAWYGRMIPDLITRRSLCVFDEAHGLPGAYEMLFSDTVNDKFISEISFPLYSSVKDIFRDIQPALDCIDSQDILLFLEKVHSLCEDYIALSLLDDRPNEVVSKARGVINLLDLVFAHPENWKITLEDKKSMKVKICAIDMSSIHNTFSKDLSNRFLYMSATITELTAKRLGISNYVYIKVANTWDIKNAPIICVNIGSGTVGDNNKIKYFKDSYQKYTKKEIDYYTKCSEFIEKLIERKNHDRGIIHALSKACAVFICKMLENKECYKRIFPVYSVNDWRSCNKKFLNTEGGVIITASLSEGVDLKGDMASWCALVKPVVLYSKEEDLYKNLKIDHAREQIMASTAAQQAGRIVRTESDKAQIYLLDTRFVDETYIKRHEHPYWYYMPPYWHKAWWYYVENEENRKIFTDKVRSLYNLD